MGKTNLPLVHKIPVYIFTVSMLWLLKFIWWHHVKPPRKLEQFFGKKGFHYVCFFYYWTSITDRIINSKTTCLGNRVRFPWGIPLGPGEHWYRVRLGQGLETRTPDLNFHFPHRQRAALRSSMPTWRRSFSSRPMLSFSSLHISFCFIFSLKITGFHLLDH